MQRREFLAGCMKQWFGYQYYSDPGMAQAHCLRAGDGTCLRSLICSPGECFDIAVGQSLKGQDLH